MAAVVAAAKTLIGPYEVQARLGQGGGGAVYRAWDTRLRRTVALKITMGESAEVRARLWREARTLAQIEHPHLVQVYDVGEADGQVYVAMQLLSGPRLSDLLDEPWSPELAGQLTMQLCSALDALHEAGFTHRDIKPSNILFDEQGGLRLVDLGLAKSSLPEDNITETGHVVGTVGYMAPEQIDGQPCTPASDVFAVGVVLYCLLTQQHPFVRESASGTAMANALASYAALTDYRSDVPASLCEVVQRAMSADPDDRYEDAYALAQALEATGVVGSPPQLRAHVQTHSSADAVVPATARRAWPRALAPVLLLGGLGLAILSAVWATDPGGATARLPQDAQIMVVPAQAPQSQAQEALLGLTEHQIWHSGPGLRPRRYVPGRAAYTLHAEVQAAGVQVVLRSPKGEVLDTWRASDTDAWPHGAATAVARWLGSTPSGGEVPLDAWAAYYRGSRALRGGGYEQAAEAFRDALRAYPRFTQALLHLREIDVKPPPGSSIGLELNPAERARWRATELTDRGDGLGALRVLYAAQTEAPEDVHLTVAIMDLRFREAGRDYDAVIELAERVLTLDPRHHQAASRLLRAAAWRGQGPWAKDRLQALGALEDASPTLRGELALYAREYADAIRLFELAERQSRDSYAIHMNIAAHILAGRAGRATELADRVLHEARLRDDSDEWAAHLGAQARLVDERYGAARAYVIAWAKTSSTGRLYAPNLVAQIDRLSGAVSAQQALEAARQRWAQAADVQAKAETLAPLAHLESDPDRLKSYLDWLQAAAKLEMNPETILVRAILQGRLQIMAGARKLGPATVAQAIIKRGQIEDEGDLCRRVKGLFAYAEALHEAGRAEQAKPVLEELVRFGYSRLWCSPQWLWAKRRLKAEP